MYLDIYHILPEYEGVSKSFRTQPITKYTLTTMNTRSEAIKMVMKAKLTRLTHEIANTTAPRSRELHHLQFSLQAASAETFGYILVLFLS
jgi:hypothetical protein